MLKWYTALCLNSTASNYKTKLTYLCVHLWCASLMAEGVQHKDNLDAIQTSGMQTKSFWNRQFSAEPCKRVSVTCSIHVLASKAFSCAFQLWTPPVQKVCQTDPWRLSAEPYKLWNTVVNLLQDSPEQRSALQLSAGLHLQLLWL